MVSKKQLNPDKSASHHLPQPKKSASSTSDKTAPPQKIAYSVAHTIPGRIRFRVPLLAKDSEYAEVRAIHTAVKGRARYKINGLYQEKALKRYLEFRLPQEQTIAQVRANCLTGNVLVIFHHAIALLLQNLVLDYRKETRKLPKATDISTAPETAKTSINKSNLDRVAASTQAQKISSWSQKQNIPESVLLLQNSLQKQLDQAGSQLILVSSVVGTLVLSTVLLHRSGLDIAILLAIQKLHSPLLDRIMRGITSLSDSVLNVVQC